jgi:hypothetical protein
MGFLALACPHQYRRCILNYYSVGIVTRHLWAKGLFCMTPFSSVLVDLEAFVTTELSHALGILMYYDQ